MLPPLRPPEYGKAFPAAGVHAPGPFGQIETGTDQRRGFWPAFPPATNIGFGRLDASGAGQQNRIYAPGPVVLKLLPLSSFAGGAERWEWVYAPDSVSQLGATFPGYVGARDVAYLPSEGWWVFTCRARNGAGANLTDSATFAMYDASNPDVLRTLYPRVTTGLISQQSNVALPGGDLLVLSLAQVTEAVALEVINLNAAVLRIGFGAPAAAATGYQLNAAGSPNDRVRFESRMLCLHSVHCWTAAAGNVLAIVWE